MRTPLCQVHQFLEEPWKSNRPLNYLKINYHILLVKIVILALFIWTIYMGLSYVLSRWQYEIVTSDLLTLIRNREFISSLKWFFTPTYLVLLPTIGIFLDRQMGWFLITSFFYFVISRLASFYWIQNHWNLWRLWRSCWYSFFLRFSCSLWTKKKFEMKGII